MEGKIFGIPVILLVFAALLLAPLLVADMYLRNHLVLIESRLQRVQTVQVESQIISTPTPTPTQTATPSAATSFRRSTPLPTIKK